MNLRILVGIRLIEGVGRDNVHAAGFHDSCSPFSFVLATSEASVLALGGTYAGYLAMGSPKPLLASLNLF